MEGCLPEVLIQKYVKTVRSSFNNPCCALVPYQPPEKLITEILERDNNTGKSNKHGNSGEEEDDENSHMDMDDWEYTMMWELFLKNSSNQNFALFSYGKNVRDF